MADITQMMLQQGFESANNVPDIGGAIQKGAQLAQTMETIQHNRALLEQQKAEVRERKIKEVSDDLLKAKNLSGKALTGYRKFLANKITTYKVEDVFDPDTVEMVTASPDNIDRLEVIIDNVQTGSSTFAEAVEQLKNQNMFYDITPDKMKELRKASEIATNDKTQKQIAEDNRIASMNKQIQAQNAAPVVDQEKKIREIHTKLNAAGGNAAIDKTLATLEEIYAQMEKGEVKTGGFIKGLVGKSGTAQAALDAKTKIAKDAVLGAVPMKELLADPNPTVWQIQSAQGRVWDDALPTAENKRRVKALIEEVKANRKNANNEFRKYKLTTDTATKAPKEGSTYNDNGKIYKVIKGHWVLQK